MEQWVKDMKEEAMRKRLMRQPRPDLNVPAMMYTGAGADGVVQPEQPAGIGFAGKRPFEYHEGEMMRKMPEGTFILNAPTTSKAYGNTMFPSYQSGGMATDDPLNVRIDQSPPQTIRTFNAPEVEPIRIAPINQPTVEPVKIPTIQTGGQITNDIVNAAGNQGGSTNNPYQLGSKEYAYWEQNNRPEIEKEVSGMAGRIVTDSGKGEKAKAQYETIKGGEVKDVPLPEGTPMVEDEETIEDDAYKAGIDYTLNTLKGTNEALTLEGRKAVDDLSLRQQQERSAKEQQLIQAGVDPGQARVEMQLLRNQQETDMNNLAASYGIAGIQARERAAETLMTQGLMGQQFQFDKQKYGNTKAWTDFEYTAQYGSDEDVIAAYKTATGKDLNPSAVAEIRGYARSKRAQDVESGDIANDAARLNVTTAQMQSIINDINNGVPLDTINATYGTKLTSYDYTSISAKYRRELTAADLTIDAQEVANEAARLGVSADRLGTFIDAVNSGADLNAANAASGLALTPQQFDGITERYRQAVEAANVSLSSAKNKLGDEMYASIQEMINSGSSMNVVNSRLMEQGKQPLTYDEYKSMLDATPLGERNWGRKMTAANMLLTSPGAENKIKAEVAYNELFPGVDFTGVFDKIAAEERYEDFASGLAKMAEYIAADLSYEEAYGLLAAGGAANKMGVEANQLRNIYNSMRINAVDAEWEEMETSDFWNTLNEEERIEQREFFKQKMLGQLDYTTLHEYEIYNPDGTLNMTVYGRSSDEADKKAASLGAGYTVKDTGKVKFQMASTLVEETATTGIPVTPSLAGSGSDKPVGTRFIEGGRAYEVGAGGEIKELEISAADEAWTKMGDDLLALGKKDNPYYQGILEARAKSIIDGSHEIKGSVSDEALYAEMLRQAPEWKPQTASEKKKDGQYDYINNAPDVGSIINVNGELYKVITKKHEAVPGDSHEYFEVMYLKDGKTKIAFATTNGGFKIS